MTRRRGLSWTVRRDAGTARVALDGEITETGDPAPLLRDLAPDEDVVLDLSGVRRVNSCGARSWLRFVAALQAAHPSFVLERCSVAFVNQLMMIPRFAGAGRLVSIFVPYSCERCDAEQSRLLERKPGSAAALAETVLCPTCGEAMILDDVPGRYAAIVEGDGQTIPVAPEKSTTTT